MNANDKPKYNIVRDDFSNQTLCDAALEVGLYDFDEGPSKRSGRIGDDEEDEEECLGILEAGDLFEGEDDEDWGDELGGLL